MSRSRSGDLDITKNIRLIEWLKSEILNRVAETFSLLVSGTKASQETLVDCLSSIIVACYLLARRLGIHYALIDQKIHEKIRLGIIEENDIEKSYGDLSDLQQHLKQSDIDP